MIARVVAVFCALLTVGTADFESRADSGLPLPRFVSLGSDEINLRAGPGSQYPIEWIYVRESLPVEVIAEFDNWRRIRDHEGVEGWVYHALLSGRRGVLIRGEGPQDLLSRPRGGADPVARAEPGVIGALLRCPAADTVEGDFCYVDLGGHRGWMPRAELYGVYPFEEVN